MNSINCTELSRENKAFKPLQLKCLEMLVSRLFLLCNEQESGFWKTEISGPGKVIMEALALINPPQIYCGHFVLWGNKNTYCHFNVIQRATECFLQREQQKAHSSNQKQEFRRDSVVSF